MEDLKVTRKNAMMAKCADCCGHWVDGKEDCEVTSCPLYPYMKYRKMDPDLSWTRFNPGRVGRVLMSDCSSGSVPKTAFKRRETTSPVPEGGGDDV